MTQKGKDRSPGIVFIFNVISMILIVDFVDDYLSTTQWVDDGDEVDGNDDNVDPGVVMMMMTITTTQSQL